jgi:hypothetical protein
MMQRQHDKIVRQGQRKLRVYKLQCRGKRYYRAGYGAEDAAENKARELGVSRTEIEILEGGKPQ